MTTLAEWVSVIWKETLQMSEVVFVCLLGGFFGFVLFFFFNLLNP
jgi:hypothetical protein